MGSLCKGLSVVFRQKEETLLPVINLSFFCKSAEACRHASSEVKSAITVVVVLSLYPERAINNQITAMSIALD